MSTNPEVQVQRSPRSGGGLNGRLIAAGVVGIILLILILQNTKGKWEFHFFFWWVALPPWLMLILWLIVGFAIGFVLSAILRRRKKRELRRRAQSV